MHVVVVYVHGLWLGGQEGFLLRRRLAAALGAETRSFTYSSMRSSLSENAAALKSYLGAIQADTVHVVGHSLGGLVILESFELEPRLAPGRVVLLGSPVRGSRSARRLARVPFGRALMGRAHEPLLTVRERHWGGTRDLGIIAGNRPIGIGRLLGPMGAPNDGTVWEEETRLAEATTRLTLPISHSGMVYSAAVARQTAAFLRLGRFERGP